MNVLIGVKCVVDSNIKVRVNADETGVEIEHSKMSINPFDENAIEEAVKLKEQGFVNDIIALSIGNNKCVDILRLAIARGASRAIWVNTNLPNVTDVLSPLTIANIFKYFIIQEKPDIILFGKQAIDDDNAQIGSMVAGILNYPQSTAVSKIEIINLNTIHTTCEVDSGVRMMEIHTPAVITTDLHLNTPRFIKLPQLMMAKKKEITEISFESMNIPNHKTMRIIAVQDGEMKKDCQFLSTTEEFITTL